MTLLLRPHPATVEGDRSRYWLEILWKKAPKRRYTQEEAAAIVVANWDRSISELRKEVILP